MLKHLADRGSRRTFCAHDGSIGRREYTWQGSGVAGRYSRALRDLPLGSSPPSTQPQCGGAPMKIIRRITASSSRTQERLRARGELAHRDLLQHAPNPHSDERLKSQLGRPCLEARSHMDGGPARAL
jgi:hypothetical protein